MHDVIDFTEVLWILFELSIWLCLLIVHTQDGVTFFKCYTYVMLDKFQVIYLQIIQNKCQYELYVSESSMDRYAKYEVWIVYIPLHNP